MTDAVLKTAAGARFRLRRAGPADLDAILPLAADLHESEGEPMPPDAAAAAVGGLLARPECGAIWVMEAEGAVVGYAAVAWGYSISFGGRDGFLDEICVARAWRGRGVGRAALVRIVEELRSEGVLALHLEANRDKTRAVAFYRELGFDLRERYHLMSLAF